MQMDEQTRKFLEEREEKLGARITIKAYALFYLSSSGEKREHGVFLYSDGETFVFEDFERTPAILGIEIKRGKKEEYVKMERSFKKRDIKDVSIVAYSDALESVRQSRPCRKAGLLTRLLRKTLLEIELNDGTRYYFEMMDPKQAIAYFK